MRSLLQHVKSLVVGSTLSMWDLISMWDLPTQPGIKPGPLHWEYGVLAAGPPGKSQNVSFIKHILNYNCAPRFKKKKKPLKHVSFFYLPIGEANGNVLYNYYLFSTLNKI